MADTQTVNYALVKPEITGSPTTWGNKLNADMDIIDSQMFANSLGILSIGSIVMFAGATAPPNFKMCDGTVYNNTDIPLLAPVLNNRFNAGTSAVAGTSSAVPNLVQRFPLGAGTTALGATGGTFTYNIPAACLPAHQHPITDVAHTHGVNQSPHVHPDPGHGHSAAGSQDAHAHNIPGVSPGYGVGSIFPPEGMTNSGSMNTDSRQPNVYVSINGAFTGIQAANANISLNTSGSGITHTENFGSGAAITITPPYVSINFIIRYQ